MCERVRWVICPVTAEDIKVYYPDPCCSCDKKEDEK